MFLYVEQGSEVGVDGRSPEKSKSIFIIFMEDLTPEVQPHTARGQILLGNVTSQSMSSSRDENYL